MDRIDPLVRYSAEGITIKRYHLQVDDGASVSIDDQGQCFPSDDDAFASAAVMAGRILGDVRGKKDRQIEVRVETDCHRHLGTVTAIMRRGR